MARTVHGDSGEQATHATTIETQRARLMMAKSDIVIVHDRVVIPMLG